MLRNFIKRVYTLISNFFVKWAEGILARQYKYHRALVGTAIKRAAKIEDAGLDNLVDTVLAHSTEYERKHLNIAHIKNLLDLPYEGLYNRDNLDILGIDAAVRLLNSCRAVSGLTSAISLFELMNEMENMVEELMQTKRDLNMDTMRHFFTSRNANPMITEMVLAYGKCLVENHPNYKPRKKREARASEPVQEVEPIAIPEFNVDKAIAEAVEAVAAVEDEPVIHARPEGGYHLSHEGVIQIREFIKTHPEMTYTEIGKLFNISQVAVSKHAIAIGLKRK